MYQLFLKRCAAIVQNPVLVILGEGTSTTKKLKKKL